MKIFHANKHNIGIISLISAAVLAAICSFMFPDITGRVRRTNESQIWTLDLSLQPAPVASQLATILPKIERTLRSQDQVEGLIISTTPEHIVANFYSRPEVSPREFAITLEAILNSLRDSGTVSTFEYTYFYEAISNARKGSSVMDELRDSNVRTLLHVLDNSQQKNVSNIFGFSHPSIVISATQTKTSDLDSLDLILQKLHTIPGVQKAYATNVEVPFLKVEGDPRELIQLGLSPLIASSTLQEHLSGQSGVPDNTLGNSSYVFRSRAKNISELCSLSFPLANSRSSLRICDVANIEPWLQNLEFHLAGSTIRNLEKQLRSQSNSKTNQQNSPTKISVLLHSDAVAKTLLTEILKIAEKISAAGGERSWKVDFVQDAPQRITNLVIFFFCLVSLVALARTSSRKFGHRKLLLFLIAHSLGIWSVATYAIGISTEIANIGVPLLAGVIAYGSICCENLLRGSTAARVAPWAFGSLSLGLGMFVIFSREFANGGEAGISDIVSHSLALVSAMFGYIFAPRLQGESSPESIKALLPTRLPMGSLSLLLPAIGVAVLIIPQVVTSSSILAVAGFSSNTDIRVAQQTAAELERYAKEENATTVVLGPSQSSQLELRPSTFAFIRASKMPIDEILQSLSPRVVGEISLAEAQNRLVRHPIVVKSRFAGLEKSQNVQPLSNLTQWLETVQIPLRNGETSPVQENIKKFIPLSALVTATWDKTLMNITSSNIGELVLADMRDPSSHSSLRKKIQAYLNLLSGQKDGSVSTHIYDSNDRLGELANIRFDATLTLAAAVFLAGVLFFASIGRAFLSVASFFAVHFVVSGAIHAFTLPHGQQELMGTLRFPSSATWISILLVCFWAIMLKTADYRRAMNMTLDEALFLQMRLTRQIRHWGLIPILTVVVVGFVFSKFAELAAVTVAMWAVCGYFFPDWMLFWTSFAEKVNRISLKLKIHLSRSTLVVFFALSAGVFAQNGEATTNTSQQDSRCQKTVAIILPIVGRPKGKEPAPFRAIFAERLAQETPCAWTDNTLTERFLRLSEELRDSASQEKLAEKMAAMVAESRAEIEKNVLAKVPPEIQKIVPEIRIIGGFYEEFYGAIAFTIIDFRNDNAPILSKISTSEEMQTEAISKMAIYLRGENIQFYEEILGEATRLPVFIEPVESLDKHPLSENLAGEIGLFLNSRFLNPVNFSLFERKTFFRIEKNRNRAAHTLNVRIRRESTRLYASVTATAREGTARRTAWIEGDISLLPEFEEEILSVATKTLANAEGITDYFLGLGVDMWALGTHTTQMVSLQFRQNLGNAGLGLRLRSGTHQAESSKEKYSLVSVGGCAGWQFFDFRWLVADSGMSIDAGLASANSSSATEARNLWLSIGGYAQAQVLLRKNLAVLGRVGVEQPLSLGTSEQSKTLFRSYYGNAAVGIGFTF